MAITTAPAAPMPASPPPTKAPAGYRPARWPSLAYAAGLVLIFLGERVLESGRPQTLASVFGVGLLLVAVVARLARQSGLPATHRAPERTLVALYLVGIAAIALYFLNSDLLLRLTGKALEQRMPRVSGAIAALWPALLVAGTLPVLFVEMSLATMAKAPVLETGRVRSALLSGLGIAFALVFAFSLSYVAAERDLRADFSYFRTAKPGESTKKIVAALDKPVAIHLFFPPGNEVREEVDRYFAELARSSRFLEVQRWDHALHPAKARELGVSGNGVIVVARDTMREQLGLPVEIDRARGQLKSLDQEVQKRLLGVTRKEKIAYFIVGHDERAADPTGDTDRRATIKTLRNLLTDQNVEPRDLGMAQGLATDVPKDASLLLIIGPQKPFDPAEISSIQRFIDRNGRLLLALDPESGVTLDDLLASLAIKYNAVTLADDRSYLPLAYNDSDRVNIGTSTFSSHVSVTTNTRFGRRAGVLMMGAGSLSKTEKGALGIVTVDFSVRSEPTTWADKNGNYKFDDGAETRGNQELVAAITKRTASAIGPEEEARVIVMADSDVIADRAIRNPGNQYLLLDVLRWLGGEERISGAVSSEEDVPVEHTRKQDMLWFYLSIFAVPALVLGIGFFTTRKRRSARRAVKTPPTNRPPQAPQGPAPTAEVSR
ncbi:MAG TPA: DUF4350 domain-containing protein [Polyangia bacterium]